MKKIFVFLLLMVVSFALKAQYPIQQNLGSDSTIIYIKGAARTVGGFINGVYTDTTAANQTRIRQYQAAQIFTTGDSAMWFRSVGATKWIRMNAGGGGSPTTDTFYWRTGGNYITDTAGYRGILGTINNKPLIFMTNNQKRLILTEDGLQNLGTTNKGFMMYDTTTGVWSYAAGGSGVYTAGNGTYLDGSQFKLGGTLTENTTITGGDNILDINNTQSSKTAKLLLEDGAANLMSTGGVATSFSAGLESAFMTSLINGEHISQIEVNYDSIILKPHLGNIHIDSLSKATSIGSRRVMVRDTVNQRVEEIDPALLATTSLPISSLTAATGTNDINNSNYAQTWRWNTLSGNGLLLSSSSTNSSNGSEFVKITRSGLHSSSSVSSYSLRVHNGHSGTSPYNYGVYSTVSNGGTAIYGSGNDGNLAIGGDFVADYGVTGIAGRFTVGTNGAIVNRYAIIVPSGGGRVGIGTSSPNASALLDVTSTTQGAVLPRMNTTQMNAISSPVAGLMVYNSDSTSYCYYNGSAWLKMGSGSIGVNIYNSDGTLTGNRIIAGANYNVKFDNVNGFTAGNGLTVTDDNYVFGGGVSNTFSGYYSGGWGGDNTFSGDYSGGWGENNIFSGYASGGWGGDNTFSGDYSGGWGKNNTFSGAYSGGFGNGLKSKSYGGAVFGTYNDSTNATSSIAYNATNRAFQIGIGTEDNARANAVTVLFNGKTGINTTTPEVNLHVVGATGDYTAAIIDSHEDLTGEILNVKQSGAKKFSFHSNGAIEMAETTDPTAAATGYNRLYAQAGKLYTHNDDGRVAQVIQNLQLVFGAGSGADSDTTAFTTSAIYGSFYNDADTIVVTSMRSVLQGTSPDVTYKVWYNDSLNVEAGATALVTAGSQVTNTTTGTNVTSFDVTKIPPGVWVWVKTSTVATKPKYFSLTLNGYRK